MEFALAAASAIATASATVAATVVAAGPLAVAAFNAVNLAAAGVAASALLSGLLPNVPGSSSNPLEWVADMDAPLSVAYGANVAAAGRLDYASDGYGPDNQYTSLVSTLSVGPIKGFNQYRSNDLVTTFGANDVATSGPHAGKMWLQRKVGTQPQNALTSPSGLNGSATIPEWGSTYKQSGRAVCMLTLQENSKGSEFRGGEEKQLHVFDGVYGWDPRLDSTWPGGSGACRLDDPSTWVWIEEGCIAALNWAIGRWDGSDGGSPAAYGIPYQSKQVAGIGSSLDGIDVDALIAGANIADANGWKVRAYPDTGMDESLVLDMLLQSSGCVRNRVAGKISCVSRAAVHPSVVTITEADMAGPVELQLGVKRKERRNSAIASFWSAANDYEVVPIEEVSDPAWVTEDRGKKRLTGLRFNYVPDKDQAAVLTYLTLANLREPARGVIPCKPHMRQIKPGHRFTITVAHYALSGVKVLCTKREFDPMTGVVKLHFVAETDAKYTAAFLKTGVVPGQPPGPTDPGDTVDPPTLATISATGDTVTINWTNGVARFFRTLIFQGQTATFADATQVASKGGEPGAAQSAVLKPGPGTWYFWLVTKSMPFEDYSDAVALGSVVVTVEIDTANLNDLNILRRTGGGDYTGDLNATLGAAWGTTLTGRPANVASLTGTEPILNTDISLSASGVLTGAGTSVQVTLSSLPGTVGSTQVADGAVTGAKLADNAVDLAGLKVTGKSLANVDNAAATKLAGIAAGATVGADFDTNVTNVPANIASLAGTEAILNTAITIAADGSLTGAGGGQVTLPGLGAGALATLNTVGAAQIDAGAVTAAKLADGSVDLAGAKVTGAGPLATSSLTEAKVRGRYLGAYAGNAAAITAGLQDGDIFIDTSLTPSALKVQTASTITEVDMSGITQVVVNQTDVSSTTLTTVASTALTLKRGSVIRSWFMLEVETSPENTRQGIGAGSNPSGTWALIESGGPSLRTMSSGTWAAVPVGSGGGTDDYIATVQVDSASDPTSAPSRESDGIILTSDATRTYSLQMAQTSGVRPLLDAGFRLFVQVQRPTS